MPYLLLASCALPSHNRETITYGSYLFVVVLCNLVHFHFMQTKITLRKIVKAYSIHSHCSY